MSLSSYKITDSAINSKGVIAAPDKLSGTAAQNKAIFDRLIRESVKDLYNGLIDLLSSSDAADPGAENIGAAEISGVVGDGSVQGALAGLKALVDACETQADAAAALALKEDKTVTANHFKAVNFNESTGVFTFTRESGSTVTIDTLLEKVAVNFSYDSATQSLILTLKDGTTQTVSLSDFITELDFLDSDQIDFSVSDHSVTATVKSGSITDTMLSSALIATLQGYVREASGYATAASNAKDYAVNARDRAASSASAAYNSALTAEGNADAAVSAKNTAEAARNDAIGAKDVAENAMAYALWAKEAAESAKDGAVTAKTAAESAASDAAAASGQAVLAAGSAASSASDAEAYGAGTRSGEPVGPSDPAYHNNAEYYSQLAVAAAETFTVDDAISGSSTNPVQNRVISDALDEKLDLDGRAPLATVGNAEQLVSTVRVTDQVPYLFRPSGGSADIGNREYDTVVGGTIAWNQLVQNNASSVTIPSGHKYAAYISGAWSVGQSSGTAITVAGSGGDMLFDLTLMFGSAVADHIYALEEANAGDGVAWFRALFPKPYYAYNAGELLSVSGLQSHDMTGFNLWDEEWELGSISDTTGENQINSNRIRSVNYIPAIPNTEYYVKHPNTLMRICYYDADKNFISATSAFTQSSTHTTPANVGYIRFWNEGTVYNHDICINLSWSGYRDGEYEPYKLNSYPLDNSLTLRGIPKLDADGNLYYDGDIYAADGTVTRRYGVVNMGTLDWSYYSDDRNGFYAAVSDRKYGYGIGVISSMYNYIGTTNNTNALITMATGTMAAHRTNTSILVKDTRYTDANIFKTAMSGVYLVYEIDTPTAETARPFQSPQIVDDFGTERYVVAEQGGVAVPVGHRTEYPANLRDKLQHLPDLADGDGRYVISQSGTSMALAPLPGELPVLPSEDGTYSLRCVVSGGSAALAWVRGE